MPGRKLANRAYRTTEISCVSCGSLLKLRCDRDIGRKRFCSKACRLIWQKSQVGPAVPLFSEARKCTKCGIDYIARANKQVYCTRKCGGIDLAKRARLKNNDLKSHLKRLLIYKGRKQLSLDYLLALFGRQYGKCALTGVTMTWLTDSGRVHSNVSIDRISSFGGYTEDNVQLVCRVANVMKNDMSQADFVSLCRKVAEIHGASAK